MSGVIEQITEWLNECAGQSVLIEKVEQGDRDRTRIRVDQVSIQAQPKDPDDYVAEREIMIHGDGAVLLESGQAPLPEPYYEIALIGVSHASKTSQTLHIVTDRASYLIEKQNDGAAYIH
ncbi:hypothetical protein [Paenibacillus turpanensis]|uniref:hypothetical protein n=1 Tax=Paenibacillus turpanensis TaxID=2689078 RepID=UPI00140770D9|nr:hypothetical protein [Paenibacillus turpanensis]